MINKLLLDPPDWLFVQVRPSGCSQCPFGTSVDENLSNPDEGYYNCSLLGDIFWGEDPQCTTRQWIAKAFEAERNLLCPNNFVGSVPNLWAEANTVFIADPLGEETHDKL